MYRLFEKMQVVRIAILGLVACTLMACEPKVDRRGHMREESMVEQIEIGSTTKDQIERKFGSPSSISSFGADTWYYINSRKEAHAFFRPEVTEQEVIKIEFDETGVVQTINGFGLDDSQKVAFVDKTTPTEGHSLGFMEQVLGNLGHFNRPRELRTPGR